MCPRLGGSDGGVRAVSCSLKKVKESVARDGSKSPPESSDLAFDNAAVAFTASGQSIIDKGGASNDATTTMSEAVGGIAALGDELCRELFAELSAALGDELCRELFAELLAALGDEPCAKLCAALDGELRTALFEDFAPELTRTFATG